MMPPSRPSESYIKGGKSGIILDTFVVTTTLLFGVIDILKEFFELYLTTLTPRIRSEVMCYSRPLPSDPSFFDALDA